MGIYPNGSQYIPATNYNPDTRQGVFRKKDGVWKQTHEITDGSKLIQSTSDDGVNACAATGSVTRGENGNGSGTTFHLVSASNVDRLYETQDLSYPYVQNPGFKNALLSGDATTIVLHDGTKAQVYKK